MGNRLDHIFIDIKLGAEIADVSDENPMLSEDELAKGKIAHIPECL